MRWMTVWTLVLLLVLLIVMAAPVMAQSWTPDEWGTAVIIGNNPASVPAVSASSWELWRVNEISMFGTLLAPERGHIGCGLDGGQRDAIIRVGAGYVEQDLWGLYLRMRF